MALPAVHGSEGEICEVEASYEERRPEKTDGKSYEGADVVTNLVVGLRVCFRLRVRDAGVM